MKSLSLSLSLSQSVVYLLIGGEMHQGLIDGRRGRVDLELLLAAADRTKGRRG